MKYDYDGVPDDDHDDDDSEYELWRQDQRYKQTTEGQLRLLNQQVKKLIGILEIVHRLPPPHSTTATNDEFKDETPKE